MELPPSSGGTVSTTPTAAATAAAAATLTQPPPPPSSNHGGNYADSDFSPRSRNTDSWDEPPSYAGGGKLRLMCSYGGHIVPRPHDKSLCYVGGDTRIIVVDRHTSLSELSLRLSKTLLNDTVFSLKYQLPNEDLDSLITVTTDEDLENMIDEYDRINANSTSSSKASRLRLFLFPSNSEAMSSIGSLIESSTKSDDWFLNALNSATSNNSAKVFSESSSVNCLLGLDDDIGNGKYAEAQLDGSFSGKHGRKINGPDVHSVPDSPMVDTTSSFGSTSSSPSMANLPPIKVHVEENQRLGIEEQLSQMSVGVGAAARVEQKQQEADGGFAALSSPPAPSPSPMVVGAVASGVPPVVGGEYPGRVFSDDERSDHSGHRKAPQTQPQQQPVQMQPKVADLPSPDSVSSDSSITNPLSRQRQYIYQEHNMVQSQGGNRVSPIPVEPKMSDQNTRNPVPQQVQDSGYVLQSQYDQQMHQQQQQYVHAGQFIHHTPSGAVPMTSYYPIYPSQQQHHHPQHPALEHQYPFYFVQARPTQAYNLPVQQTSYNDSAPTGNPTRPQTPPPPTIVTPTSAYNPSRTIPASKPEMATGTYRTPSGTAPQLVQIAPGQHPQQYVGYSQIHHPSQSIPPTSAAATNYGYEFTDSAHAQIYYTQPLPPQMGAQHQTMASAHTAVLPEASSQLPVENFKQQVRTSQP